MADVIASCTFRIASSGQDDARFRLLLMPVERPAEMVELSELGMVVEGTLAQAFAPGKSYRVTFEEL